MVILAGDIGGTNTRLGLFDENCNPLGGFVKVNTRGQSDLVAEAGKLLAGRVADRACFGIAGPVFENRATVANAGNPAYSGAEIAAALGIKGPSVLVNDMIAHAFAVTGDLPPGTVVIQRGASGATGNRAIIAAGTGLGEAGLFHDAGAGVWRPFPSEGGHSDFGPGSALEAGLWTHVHKELGHGGPVHIEAVVSGIGLLACSRYLHGGRFDSPKAVSDAANAGDPAALDAMRLFMACYGGEAASLAVKFMATGGLFIMGNIAVANRKFIEDGSFMAGWKRKPTVTNLLARMPIYLVLDPDISLRGAARGALAS